MILGAVSKRYVECLHPDMILIEEKHLQLPYINHFSASLNLLRSSAFTYHRSAIVRNFDIGCIYKKIRAAASLFADETIGQGSDCGSTVRRGGSGFHRAHS
jgi:hypothetical protein